ncbi:MAG: NUDIX hydrolase [Alistipes sp.]|nr:NUDIX hydrolase [Alistipes sp.]
MKDNATYTIYFGATPLQICSEQQLDNSCVIEADEQDNISRAKLLKKVESCKSVTLLTSNVEQTFKRLCEEFKVVRAAGGVVESASHKLLMIRLRNRWDLPKGHIEAGEDSRTAALREVREETGITAEAIDNTPLYTTWHAYNTYGEWELKSTDWWRMQATSDTLEPQHDEGITEVRWFTPEERDIALSESYETIKEVVRALDAKR